MSISVRCRGPSGQVTLQGLDPALTFSQLSKILCEKTGVPENRQEILVGFPPKLLVGVNMRMAPDCKELCTALRVH